MAVGETKSEVLMRCGEPVFAERSETITDQAATGPNRLRVDSYSGSWQTDVETWTYNQGPGKFVKILTFAGSRLVSIQDGPYGK